MRTTVIYSFLTSYREFHVTQLYVHCFIFRKLSLYSQKIYRDCDNRLARLVWKHFNSGFMFYSFIFYFLFMLFYYSKFAFLNLLYTLYFKDMTIDSNELNLVHRTDPMKNHSHTV